MISVPPDDACERPALTKTGPARTLSTPSTDLQYTSGIAVSVSVERAEFDELCRDALSWRRYWAPEWIAARERQFERDVDQAVAERLRDLSEDAAQILAGNWSEQDEARWRRNLTGWSKDLSSLYGWRASALAGLSFERLEQRRYPWLHDPSWRSPWEREHGEPYAGGPVAWSASASEVAA